MHNDLKFTNAGEVVEHTPVASISTPILGIRYVMIDGITVAEIYDHGEDGAEIVSQDYQWVAECGCCSENRMFFNDLEEALEFARSIAKKIQLFSKVQ